MGCASSMSSESKMLDVMDGKHGGKENGCQIQKLYYFDNVWGRMSALEFMMDKAGYAFTVEGIDPVQYYAKGMNKKMGNLPIAERSDGFFMNET